MGEPQFSDSQTVRTQYRNERDTLMNTSPDGRFECLYLLRRKPCFVENRAAPPHHEQGDRVPNIPFLRYAKSCIVADAHYRGIPMVNKIRRLISQRRDVLS